MRPFRFRAAVALELRAAEESRAQQHLARARLDLQRAEHDASRAVDAVATATSDLHDCHAEGSEAWRLSWHRSWIVRQQRAEGATRQAAALSAALVARAVAAANLARQRRRALERLRDRAALRHKTDLTRHDNKEMNLLANLRFLVGEAAKEGMHHDD